MSLQTQFMYLFDKDARAEGARIFQQGKCIVQWGDESTVDADIQDGTKMYGVLIERERGKALASCDCDYFESGDLCHHIWATILATDKGGYLRDRYGRHPEALLPAYDEDFEESMNSFLRPVKGFKPPPPPPPPKPTWDRLIEKASAPAYGYRETTTPWPEYRRIYYGLDPQPSTVPPKLRIKLLTVDLKHEDDLASPKPAKIFRKQIPILPEPADREILAQILGVEPEYSYYAIQEIPATVQLDPLMATLLLPKISATGRFVMNPASQDLEIGAPLIYVPGDPWRFTLRAVRSGENYLLSGGFRLGEEWLAMDGQITVVQAGFLIANGHLYQAEWEDHDNWISFLAENHSIEVPVSKGDALLEKLFGGDRLPRMEVPEELHFEQVCNPPKPHLKVHAKPVYDTQQNRLPAQLTFQYGDYAIAHSSTKTGFYDAASKRLILRDKEAEAAAEACMKAAGVKPLRTWNSSDASWELNAKKLPQIARDLLSSGFDVEAEGKLVKRPGAFNLGVTSGIDWFELHGQVDYDGQVVKLPELLKAMKHGESMVRLGDGSFGMLPEEWLKKLGMLPALGEAKDEHIRFRRNQTGFLDALLLAQPEIAFDEAFAHAREELRRFEGIRPGQQPASFQGTLRGYQLEGLGWFEFLRQFGFGGCLADDMGVGKTAQVLAMLEARRNGRPNPSLVVAPKSLIFNWRQEAARFTPGLRVFDYTGMDRSKEAIADHDLILTTYGTLIRDVAGLRDYLFDYVVLDESQAIKNSSTETAKAARLLRANHRLALSGTPVENHLGELWSLFEFLNPGMLGAASVFKLSGASARNPDAATRQLLARALRPFILRRTKEQVVSELPEKSEQTLYCEMEPAQRKVYNELRDHYRARLLKLVEDEGLAKSKIQILEALLRLRQAACHPRLISERAYKGPSAKLDMLLLQLEEIRQSGRKALVFSQFTSLLAIVRETLDKDGVRYAYLDGQTNDRQGQVRQFQEDPDCPLFLISLKAGGLGLNLTAAEYVFLLDPWWNPAVEAQAIDRAHRIGQQHRVFAYRLIARDTVEEKVLELQKTKRDLADSIINADNSLIAGLGREDLELLLS